jgi:hypothetical protein
VYEIIVILKALTEIAGVALLGQGVLWLIAGSRRSENIVYKLFQTLTSPVTRVARAITPRIVIDAHIGLVAFFLVAVLWVVLTAIKIKLFLDAAAAAAS